MNMENNGYPAKHYDLPTKRYVQTMDLKSDDNEIIRRYREAHDKEHFWTEIGRGIKAVGILEMEVYIQGTRLVMIVDAPADFDWDSGGTCGSVPVVRRQCHIRPEMADDGAYFPYLRRAITPIFKHI